MWRMLMLGWALSLVGGGQLAKAQASLASARADATRSKTALMNTIRARYENAILTDDNRRNWFGADGLSAKAANNYQVRRQLRIQSRHEVSNNPYLFGICNSNADDLIGTGPTLAMMTPSKQYNRTVEESWFRWWLEIGGVEKLRTSKLAKTVDGEGILVLKTVNELEHAVKLYPVDIETDQMTAGIPANMAEWYVDGLTLHPVTGRPTHFHILKTHPGDLFFPGMNPMESEKVPACYVIHWFPKFRPGQVRGVPVFTPALDLFAELRAFRKAVLAAAQIAANLTAVLQQSNKIGVPPNDADDDDNEYQPFKRLPIDRGLMTLLPPGFMMEAFDPKQPATTYEMFQQVCLGEACRPLSYPLNLALGTSQKFNFSSAKLDHVNYRSGLTVERSQCDADVMNKIFALWYPEAVLSGAIPAYDGLNLPPKEWHWPGFEPLDPTVDAQADHDRRAHGTLTDREFWAKRGYDWRDMYQQLADEAKERDRLHLEFGDPTKRSITETAAVDEDGDSIEEKPTPKSDEQPAAKPEEKKSEKPSEKVVKKAVGAADVQNTALNGAQVASMIAVCDKLVSGEYTGEATRAILKGSFPGLSEDLINTIVSELEDHEAPEPSTKEETAGVA